MEKVHGEISDEKLEQIIRDRLSNNPPYYLTFLKKLIDEIDENIPDDILFELLQPSLSAYKNESGISDSAKLDDKSSEGLIPLPSPESVDMFFRPGVRRKLYDWQRTFFDDNLQHDEREKALNSIKKIFHSLTIKSEYEPRALSEEDKYRNVFDGGHQIIQEVADRTSKKDKSVFPISRWIIFLAIIIIASLVVFGLFVDKSYRSSVTKQTLVMPSQKGTDEKNTGIQQKEAIVRQQQKKQENQYLVETKTSQENKQTTEVQQTIAIPQAVETKNLQTNQANKNPQQIQKTDGIPRTHSFSITGRYSVQIGTFKNSPNARALKTKLEKKGYKTFMITKKTKKHEKLFNVLVGKFSTREEAQSVSTEIKNAEGLHTFVTYITNYDGIR